MIAGPGRADRAIAEYAIVGDMRGAALIATDASVDWLCLDRFDATPVFFGLLDAEQGGRCTVETSDAVLTHARRYLPGTNILETAMTTAGGEIRVTDLMPVATMADAGDVGADSSAPGQLIRIVECVSGEIDITVRVAARFDWARTERMPQTSGNFAAFHADDFYVGASRVLRADGQDVVVPAVLRSGERVTLILGSRPIDAHDIERCDRHLLQTHAYWSDWSRITRYEGARPELVQRSALCLKLLTYAPSGAMVAAATTGLPEAPGSERNWDYRYAWTRDASFNVSAFLNLGHRREAAEFLRFLHTASVGQDVVEVMYGVEGPVPGEEKLTHLAGWRRSTPVIIGNEASEQKQHEIFGELLAALNLYVEQHGADGLCASLKDDLPHFVTRLADTACDRWRLPDQGIWELRGSPRHLLHSKAMCWVALDRAITMAPRIGLAVPDRWERERDAIRETCLAQGWNEETGAFTMEFGRAELDMSTLRLALMGFLDASDTRMQATLAKSEQALGVGDLFYRYRFDDGLSGDEGAFTACSFWVAALYTLSGRIEDGATLLDRLARRANDVGLFSEEIDPQTGEQLGNFPQAFTHMAVIHEYVRSHQARIGPTHAPLSAAN